MNNRCSNERAEEEKLDSVRTPWVRVDIVGGGRHGSLDEEAGDQCEPEPCEPKGPAETLDDLNREIIKQLDHNCISFLC